MSLSLRERQKLQTRGEILHAAWMLSVRDGMASTKLSDIAESAGVSEQTLYNYFASKEELTLALMDGWAMLAELQSLIADIPTELGPADTLLELARRLEWPDAEGERRALGDHRAILNDAQLRAAYRDRQAEGMASLREALAGRARRHRVSALRLDLLVNVFYRTFDVVADHQPTPLKPGRWRREVLRELALVLGVFR